MKLLWQAVKKFSFVFYDYEQIIANLRSEIKNNTGR